MERPDYLVSDVHLGAVPLEKERAFVSFLEHAGERAGTLLIAGDLFDFWFEYGFVIPGRHFRVLAALAVLVDAGIPVTLAGGNHDAWGGRFLREEVGVAFHDAPFHTVLGGGRALVAHGDGLGRGDFRYRALKTLLRSRAAVLGFRALHPELGMRIARAVSSTEAKADHDPGVRGRSRFLEQWAEERLAEDASLRWVVCGHTHLPVVHAFDDGRYYLNAGDWITHDSYIVVSPAGEPTLHRWRGAATP
ncbi:MAG: UDP-2,3-diacylglucosamine diphosphatase, partial [Longimicrobiales bacterium]